MGRQKEKINRLGKDEKKIINNLLKKIKNYKIFNDKSKERETKFNERLFDYLRQDSKLNKITNKKIQSIIFVEETYRPEFCLTYKNRKLFAIECKRLNDKSAKSKWKEGLSQSLLYSLEYKVVVFLIFDFTKDHKYGKSFGRGNSLESKFSKQMREENGLYIQVLKPNNT